MSIIKEDMIITCYQVAPPVCLTDKYKLKISILNQGKVAIPQGEMTLEETDHYYRTLCDTTAINPKQEKSFTFDVLVKPQVQLRDLNQYDTIEFKFGNQKERRVFQTFITSFVGEFIEAKPHPKSDFKILNILIFGWFGSGKSSFINGCHTLLNDDYGNVMSLEVFGSSESHNTKKFSKIPLRYKEQILGFQLWDTWGLSNVNYDSDILEKILDGIIAANWNMDDLPEDQLENIKKGYESKSNRTMHSVLFFVPWSTIRDKDATQERAQMKDSFKRIIQKGHNPILVLTLVDSADANIRNDPMKETPIIVELIKEASIVFGIPTRRITYCVNYLDQRERSFKIDQGCFRILQMAINDAIDRTKQSAIICLNKEQNNNNKKNNGLDFD